MRDPGVRWYGLALCVLVVEGCSDSAELRPWRPEDHQPPPAVAGEDRAAPEAEGAQTSPEQRIARALYAAQCQSCHGRDGRGGGPGLPPGAPAPDFTDTAWQAEQQDSALTRTILEGRGMMPAFQGKLSAEEAALLVDVVRGFGGEPEAPKAAEKPSADTSPQ